MKSTNRNSKMNIHILYTESPAPYEQSLFLFLLIEEEKKTLWSLQSPNLWTMYSQACFLSSNLQASVYW